MIFQDVFQIRHKSDASADKTDEGHFTFIRKSKRFDLKSLKITALTDIKIKLYLREWGEPFIQSYARHGNIPDEEAINKRTKQGSQTRENTYKIQQELVLFENVYIPKGQTVSFDSICKEYTHLPYEVDFMLYSEDLGDLVESKMLVNVHLIY